MAFVSTLKLATNNKNNSNNSGSSNPKNTGVSTSSVGPYTSSSYGTYASSQNGKPASKTTAITNPYTSSSYGSYASSQSGSPKPQSTAKTGPYTSSAGSSPTVLESLGSSAINAMNGGSSQSGLNAKGRTPHLVGGNVVQWGSNSDKDNGNHYGNRNDYGYSDEGGNGGGDGGHGSEGSSELNWINTYLDMIRGELDKWYESRSNSLDEANAKGKSDLREALLNADRANNLTRALGEHSLSTRYGPNEGYGKTNMARLNSNWMTGANRNLNTYNNGMADLARSYNEGKAKIQSDMANQIANYILPTWVSRTNSLDNLQLQKYMLDLQNSYR